MLNSVFSDDENLHWDGLLGVEHHEGWDGSLDWHEVVVDLLLHVLVAVWEPLVTVLVLDWVDQWEGGIVFSWDTWGEVLDSIPDLDIVFTGVFVLTEMHLEVVTDDLLRLFSIEFLLSIGVDVVLDSLNFLLNSEDSVLNVLKSD